MLGGIQLNDNNLLQPEGNFFDKYHSKNPIIKWIMKNFFRELDHFLDDAGQVCHILEAGCGEGEVTQYLSLKYGSECHIDAFDISEKVIEDAQQKYPHIHFHTGNIYEIALKNKYDLILCCEVLEHLDTPEKALKELMKVSDGYIIVSVPREPIWRCLNVLRGKYWRELGNTPGHIQHWSRNSFIRFLIKNGMEIKRIANPLPWTMILCRSIR